MADSPLTSTSWWDHYTSEAVIREASGYGCTEKVMKYICDPSKPIDIRLAVVNCLGWDINGTDTYIRCRDYYRVSNDLYYEEVDGHMNAETKCVFAYLLAMSDYFDVGQAFELAEQAHNMKPKSRAISMIYGLIGAQMKMADDWCQVYKFVAAFAYDKSLKRDMSDYAVNQIMEYIGLYKEYCN